MTYREFTAWKIYFAKQPFGYIRDDLRAGLQTSHLISPYVKKSKNLQVKDFVLKFKKKTNKPMDWRTMKQKALSWAAAFGGVKGRKDGNSRHISG